MHLYPVRHIVKTALNKPVVSVVAAHTRQQYGCFCLSNLTTLTYLRIDDMKEQIRIRTAMAAVSFRSTQFDSAHLLRRRSFAVYVSEHQ